MNQNPLISVIIPMYNGAKYLHKCVDSLLAQTYTNLEIILVDDGSTDESVQMCDELAQREQRIRVIHQANGGISVARNTGIKAAKGEYISFIDVDDWVAPIFIETLWKAVRKYQAPIVAVGRYEVLASKTIHKNILPNNEKEKLISTPAPVFTAQQAVEMTLSLASGCVTNRLFHRSLFKQILFPVGLFSEDNWMLYRLFQQVNKVAVCNVPLYYYNQTNENSISHGKFNMRMLDYFKVTDEFLVCAQQAKDTRLLHKVQRARLAVICGTFKRIMLSDFNDQNVIKPLLRELRRNLWVLLLNPRPLLATAFCVCCAINFQLTNKLFVRIYRYVR